MGRLSLSPRPFDVYLHRPSAECVA